MTRIGNQVGGLDAPHGSFFKRKNFIDAPLADTPFASMNVRFRGKADIDQTMFINVFAGTDSSSMEFYLP